MRPNNDEFFIEEVRRLLLSDRHFNFQRDGNYLRGGVCPECGKAECFISYEHPRRIQCGREKKCGWSATVRDLYPELFNNFSARYPSNDENPNATAEAYMVENRGFDLKIIGGMFDQGEVKNLNNEEKYTTVRVKITQNGYWHRIINERDVKRNGGKNRSQTPYKHKGWVPPGMTFENGDEIWITEGIFKSMAFLHIDKKSISAISAANFPRDVILEHKGKGIRWIVALDNDEAGYKHTPKDIDFLESAGEAWGVAIPPKGVDWDDLYRSRKLTPKTLREAVIRGRFTFAQDKTEKAFFMFLETRSFHEVFELNNALYRYKVDVKRQGVIEDMNELAYLWTTEDYNDSTFIQAFSQYAEIDKISNCVPQFLYYEEDELTQKIMYYFSVKYESKKKPRIFSADGSILKSEAALHEYLLSNTKGGTFDGSKTDMIKMRNSWLNTDEVTVTTLQFMGYSIEAGAYIFPDFAYKNGVIYDPNEHDYFEFEGQNYKTVLRFGKENGFEKPGTFDPSFFADYKLAFGVNGTVLMAWWLGTMFAEQIRSYTKWWAFLEYTGSQGAGKSTQIEFLWKLMGRGDYEGFDPLKATSAALARNFAQLGNMPIVLMEGDRNGKENSGKGKGGKMFEFDELKPLLNGRPFRSIGVASGGNSTIEYPFRGGVLITQNSTVDASKAILSRIVHCHCTRDHFTKETLVAAKRLERMPVESCSGFLGKVLSMEGELLNGWKTEFEKLNTAWVDAYPEIQSRLIGTHAAVAAWAMQLPRLFGSELCPDGYVASVVAHIAERMKDRQQRLGADHPMVEQFWELFDTYNFKNINGYQRQLLNFSKNNDTIVLNIPYCQQVFSENGQERLNLSELKSLLLNHSKSRPYVGQKKERDTTGSLKHCWVFKYNYQKELEG